MANPQYISQLKLPLEEKPRTRFEGELTNTYWDIFNIQCVLRLLISNFVEEAPKDGTPYVRQDGEWVPAGGGGGGYFNVIHNVQDNVQGGETHSSKGIIIKPYYDIDLIALNALAYIASGSDQYGFQIVTFNSVTVDGRDTAISAVGTIASIVATIPSATVGGASDQVYRRTPTDPVTLTAGTYYGILFQNRNVSASRAQVFIRNSTPVTIEPPARVYTGSPHYTGSTVSVGDSTSAFLGGWFAKIGLEGNIVS